MSDQMIARWNREQIDLATRLEEALLKVERLRAALQEFYPGSCPVCSGDCGSANPPVINCPMLMARDALEGKE
jgi:hypothetical protein